MREEKMLFGLFFLFLTFNVLDITISSLAIRYGAREVGILYMASLDFNMMVFIKCVAAFLLGLVLVAYQKKGLLAISCVVMLLLCVYNGVVLRLSMG